MTVNTAFTAGNVVTASQMNNFPRGLMATPVTSTTSDTSITAEEVMLTYTFTAVSGRNYLLVYHEPSIFGSTGTTVTARLRETNISGTILNTGQSVVPTATFATVRCEVVYTASASGSLTIVATLQFAAGTGQTVRSDTPTRKIPQLYAIDIGTGY